MTKRSKATEGSFAQRVRAEGGAPVVREGLGEMPLTLFLVVAGVVLWLYVRRASLGIDTHPGEQVTIKPKQPTVTLGPFKPQWQFPPTPKIEVGPYKDESKPRLF